MDHKQQTKLVVYVDEKDYRLLRAKLALLGISLSKWLREIIKKFIS